MQPIGQAFSSRKIEMRFLLLAIVLFVLAPGVPLAPAQKPEVPQTEEVAPTKELRDPTLVINELRETISILQQRLAERETTFSSLQAAYYQQLMEADVAIFRWQRRASEIIMWVVIGVVVSGVVFSGYQLWHGLNVGQQSAQTEFEVSAHRLRVTSSIVGILVLSISLAFFYLFLVEVYHIKEPGAPAAPSAPTGEAS